MVGELFSFRMVDMSEPKYGEIPLSKIKLGEVFLRDVKMDSEKFQQILESVRADGVLHNLVVTEAVDKDGCHTLIDGRHRYVAAKMAGIETVVVRFESADVMRQLELQVIANLQRVAQNPQQVSRHLVHMLGLNPLLTKAELARKVSQSEQWVEQRLALQNLIPEAQNAIEAGELTLANGYSLSKLPPAMQKEELDAAIKESAVVFSVRVRDLEKQIRDQKNASKDTITVEWKPAQHARPFGELANEYAILTKEKPGESIVLNLCQADGITTVEEAVKMALAWTMNLDPVSVEAQRAKHEQRQAEKKARAEKAKAEREAEKARKLAEQAAIAPEQILLNL